jgi:hypothetical protein
MAKANQSNKETISLESPLGISVVDEVLDLEPRTKSAGSPVSWSSFCIKSLAPMTLEGGRAVSLAPSCLIQPEVGDTVLCVTPIGSDPIIVSVLARSNPKEKMLIDCESPIEIRTPSFNMLSHNVSLTAEIAECNVGLLRRLAERVDEVVEYFSSNVGTIFAKAKRSIKRVDELDETRAGHLRLESPALLEMHAEVTAISGEQLIKMQSEQIHMG